MAASLMLAAALVSCPKGGGGDLSDGGDAGEDGDGGKLPREPDAWVKQIERADELLGGPVAQGRIGDWLMSNKRVRFVIEDAGTSSSGYVTHGGSVLGADRVRAPGEPGESRFGEVMFSLNFRGVSAESVEVIKDGKDGGEAVLRFHGHDAEFPFLDSILNPGGAADPIHADVTTDYILEPDVDWLTARVTVKNAGTTALDLNDIRVGFIMSRGLDHYLPGPGLAHACTTTGCDVSTAPFYAAVGDKVTYSFVNDRSPFAPQLEFAKVLLGTYDRPTQAIPAGASMATDLHIVVGGGGLADNLRAHALLAGREGSTPVLTVRVTGAVPGGAATPVAGARVHVRKVEAHQGVLLTGADGTVSAPFEAGAYTVQVLAAGRAPSDVQAVTLAGAGATLDVALGAPGLLVVDAKDEAGDALPARITVKPSLTGTAFPLSYGEGKLPYGAAAIEFAYGGHAEIPLAPGSYDVIVSRGSEYDRVDQAVTVAAGTAAQVNAVLHRVVDTAGWISGDFHLHARYSADAADMYAKKVAAFAAEGLEVAVNTEHEWIGDYGPTIAAMGLGAFVRGVVGTELTTTSVGHFNVFPLQADVSKPNDGAFVWYGKTIPQVMAEVRAKVPNAVLQLNHPRTVAMGYFLSTSHNPDTWSHLESQWWEDWDAMEVFNAGDIVKFETGARPLEKDWYAFLDRGKRIVATGNSDSHSAAAQEVGFPRNYVKVANDAPADLNEAEFVASVKAGKVMISAGPFLTASIAGKGPGETAQVAAGVQQLHVKVQAPVWMGPLTRLEVIQGGTIVTTVDLADPATAVVRYDADLPVTPPADTYYIVRVRGATPMHPVASGVPYALTNPIWVDVP